MGCGCSKGYGFPPQEEVERPPKAAKPYGSKRSSFGSGRLNYAEVIVDGVGAIKEKVVRSSSQQQQQPHLPPNIRPPPRHLLEGEYVAAGWPTWLSAVAGEAIRGWIPRRADSFEKLDKIGQGTYSNVYKARDLETGRIVALKKVRFDNLEPESVRFMAREIQVLRRLDHPNIIKLEGLVTSRMSCSLYLVFEYMEHDLAGLAASPGTKFSEPQVKCYLQQLLRGLDHCHTRGVLHRDIKGSNLLLDNSGILKIADFGLATFFSYEQRQPLTSRVVTLWYRPPELLLGATEYGVGVDLWSTGCILAELLAGKPIMPGRTEVEQLHKIFKLCGSPSEDYWKKSKLPHATIFKPKQPYKRCIAETFRDFPPSAVVSLETLLAIEPADRGTAAGALKSEFFSTKPFACDPSSLPKYPPSKELDAKLRDEEARRQRALGGRVPMGDSGRRVSKAVPAPDANAELPASIMKRRPMSQAVKSKSEKFSQKQEETAVGFPIDPPCPADASAVFGPPGGFAPILEYSTADFTGLKRTDEVHTMDFSRPSRSRSSNKSSNTVSNPRPQVGDALSRTKTIEESRQHETGRPKDVFCVTQSQNGEHVGLSSRPAKNGAESGTQQNGAHRVQQERPGIGGGKRINYSGPLRPSVNLDDILGQHEQQIQQAVRRSQQDKGRNRSVKTSARNAWPSASRQSNHGLVSNNSGRWKQTRTLSGGDPTRVTSETVRYDAPAQL